MDICDAEVFMGLLILCLDPAYPFRRGGLAEGAGFGSSEPRGPVKGASAAGQRVSSPLPMSSVHTSCEMFGGGGIIESSMPLQANRRSYRRVLRDYLG